MDKQKKPSHAWNYRNWCVINLIQNIIDVHNTCWCVFVYIYIYIILRALSLYAWSFLQIKRTLAGILVQVEKVMISTATEQTSDAYPPTAIFFTQICSIFYSLVKVIFTHCVGYFSTTKRARASVKKNVTFAP